MAQDDPEAAYLSNPEIVEQVYNRLKAGDPDGAVAVVTALGDDKRIVQTWINIQCDINNIKGDSRSSAKWGLAGVDYCLAKGYKVPAAMMLHNVAAFHMPEFDIAVDPKDVPVLLDAARRQVPLRREIGEEATLMWALWDLGVAELASGNPAECIQALEEGVRLAEKLEDRSAAAWCRLFIGRAKILHIPGEEDTGRVLMRQAAEYIDMNGEDWEREGVVKLLQSTGF